MLSTFFRDTIRTWSEPKGFGINQHLYHNDCFYRIS